MKASHVVPSLIFLFSAPTLAHAGQGSLNGSLADAARQAMDVAPWINLSVPVVAQREKLEWIAITSTRLVYVCSADGSAEAGLAGQASCTRATATALQRAAATHSAQSGAYSREEMQQLRRMSVTIPVSWSGDAPGSTLTMTPGNMITLSAY